MSKAPIRTAQLVSPFGPGALYTNTDGHVLLVAGLDQWFKRRNGGTLEKIDQSELDEFIIREPRLSRLLGDVGFRRAPDYRRPVRNAEAPANANLTIPAVRFPTWYRKQGGKNDNGLLKQATYYVDNETKGWGGRWVPVRFATACEHGHLNEFPWKEWAQCTCADSKGLRLEDRGGTGLESIRIRCETCPEGSPGWKGNTLMGLTHLPDDENADSTLGANGFFCSGGRPWLGKSFVPCGSRRLVAVLLSQSNLYQAQTASSLKLPIDAGDLGEQKVLDFLRGDTQWLLLERVTQRWQMGKKDSAKENVADALSDNGINIPDADNTITSALEMYFGERRTANGRKPADPESEQVRFRREEFDLLSNENDKDDPVLRVVASKVPESLSRYIRQINRIEKLTEVRALCGFSRLKEQQYSLGDVARLASQQFYRSPPARMEDVWLPAMQVRGEGIFIQLSEDEFSQWYERQRADLERRLDVPLVERMAQHQRLMSPLGRADNRWAARFLLVHTFSHLLINQLVFESGYSSAALRERLYVSCDPSAPMMAVLIYTAQGDSEGTLGGLVNLGHTDNIEQVIRRALNKASWCSADPVCSERHGASGAKRMNLAACHSCSLLPETACETINDGLDRGVVVGTADKREIGFFSALLGLSSNG